MNHLSAAPLARPAAQPDPAELEATIRQAVEAAQSQAQLAREQAQIARDQARAARDQAQQGVQDGSDAGTTSDFNIKLGENGLLITSTDQNGVTTTQPFDASNVIPPQVPDIILISVLGVIGMIMAFPIGRAIARYIDRRGVAPRVPEEVSNRLRSIEQAVDAVAIEMERMSEANRYTTRLLSERVSAPEYLAGASARDTETVARGADPVRR